MTEIIIVVAILLIAMGIMAFWLKNTLKGTESKVDDSLIQELQEKRDIAAQVPLLKETVESLKANIVKNNIERDNLKLNISSKDVVIAELNKDKSELHKETSEAKQRREELKEENKNLIKLLREANENIVLHKSTIDKREHDVNLITSEKSKDNKNHIERISILQGENKETKEELANLKSVHTGLINKNSETGRQSAKAESELEAQKKIIVKVENINKDQEEELANLKSVHTGLINKNSETGRQLAKAESELEAQKKIIVKVENINKNQEEDIHLFKNKQEELVELNSQTRSQKSALQADLNAQEKNNKKLKEDFEEQGKKLELKLGEIMQNTLDSKIKKFDESSIKGLDGLLKPFRENLSTFQKKVEQQQESSIEKFASLSKEIENVSKIGLTIGKEAENLATALKGKKQMQGSWGEMILESVLEHSGLLKGTHYETQASYRDSEGNSKRPDVVVNLPQERTVIIDSKVSLNDYEKYIRAESEEEQMLASKLMVSAFKNHIDILAKKDYTEYKIGTLQYVFMFVPIEGAFATAVQQDPKLYEYALQKNIAIVNPSTLTISLKTIYLYWQSEQSSTLAVKLFEEAGKLYDKMDGFAKSFKKIGNQLQTVNRTYDDAHKKLTEGTGNVLGRVENLKQLGARTKGKLKDSIEFQSSELDMDDVEVVIIENSELDIPKIENILKKD